MTRNNIVAYVKVKCIENRMTHAKVTEKLR